MTTSRSLDICAIGIGQGGGNLAAEWRRRGHRGIIINTARSDMRSLDRYDTLKMPSENTLYIGREGIDGAGRDPDYGAECIRERADEVRAAVSKMLEGADAFLICAGLGGGTGSASYALIEVLEPLGIPMLSAATLPSESESGITKVNAVKSANRLVSSKLDGRLFIDNERLVEAFPDLDVVAYYPQVNSRVLTPLDELNRLNGREDLWAIRSFDGEDLRKVLLSGGVLSTHVEAINEPINVPFLLELVTRCIDGGAHLATGTPLENAAYLALVIVGPESVLKGVSFKDFDEAVGQIKSESGGGAVYEGLYVGDDDTPARAYVVSASFALPERISEILDRARVEGAEIVSKINDDIVPLELSRLEDLDMFRAPERAKKSRPRGIKEQLNAANELPDAIDAMPAFTARVPQKRVQSKVHTKAPISDEKKSRVSVIASSERKKKSKKSRSKRERTAITRLSMKDQSLDDASLHNETALFDAPSLEDLVSESQPYAEAASAFEARTGAEIEATLGDASLVSIDASDEVTGFERSQMPSVGSLAERYPEIDDAVEDSKTHTDARLSPLDTFRADSELSRLLKSRSSVQSLYHDLLERFRQAPDKRARQRVANRLVDDSQKADVEVRALAVWAMVTLDDRGFRRALTLATHDTNPEISKLARRGIARWATRV